MLDAERIDRMIRDGLKSTMDSHARTVDNILAKERAEKLALIGIAQTAIEGWKLATDKNDENLELAIARLDQMKEKLHA